MGKAAMLMVLGSISIFLIISNNLNSRISQGTDYASTYYENVAARNIANSTAEMILAELGSNSAFRANSEVTLNSIFGGSAIYRVIDTTVNTEPVIKIDVTGTLNNSNHKTIVITRENSGPGFIPNTVKAAVTTNNPIEVNGSLEVDGRQHDINGNLIANTGTFGIWTTNTFSRKGNAKVGSTFGGADIAPIKAGASLPNTFRESQAYPGGYPDTPDSLLGGKSNGFPAGTLKSIALSGSNGSQYVNNPGALVFPLKGVTYVELASGGSWNPSNIQGSGVLIVHNAAKNAIIKNLNWGTFKGIIIADDIVHIHTDIIGAIIGLSAAPSSGNQLGNGTGNVLYSSEAIQKATRDIDPNTTPNYGFAQKRMTIESWYE